MNFKITKILLTILFTSCSVSNNMGQISKNESVYSITIHQDEYTPIYNILKQNLEDFPENKNQKVNYSKQINSGVLKVKLTKNRLKMIYRSNGGSSEEFKTITSKIEKIKKS